MASLSLNDAREMLGSLDKLETGGRNDIKPGTAQVLVNSVELSKTRAHVPYISAKATVLVPVQDEAGRKVGDDGYAGNFKGDQISFAFFFGDRFARDFGPFLCAAMDIPQSEAKNVTKEELQEMALSILKCDDQPHGALDGTVAIEMRGVTSAPVEDKKNPGQLKTYVNERFDRRVNLEEVAGALTDADITRFFGSEARFLELVAAESEG